MKNICILLFTCIIIFINIMRFFITSSLKSSASRHEILSVTPLECDLTVAGYKLLSELHEQDVRASILFLLGRK